MRIIGGKSKGKKIKLPNDNTTRPLRDLVKESIFNLLEHSNKFNTSISNSNILDLFSGTGSFGLECFSRGAKFITFIENYSEALRILKKNIIILDATKDTNIIEKSCFEYFELNKKIKDKFDIIFLDPPYKEDKINFLIEKIKDNQLLKKNGVLIIHRHKKDELKITSKLNIVDKRSYGISKIVIGN
ncbi:16S rRNA (guanine(966)-N(2))-methyltransferase RsmD [Candidatus Pelagibacter sp.]|nr:16S rRNA (guanine(966)-N(2))-methyltransferase RsmD [Candidatus Pelagibacter sp.]